ncbi:hypothetical protein INR49_010905 [Caranx melampygus]|nr:hypothetical protein INR49_010905 [Caranx melampygus]
MPVHRRQPSIELLELMGVVRENGNEQTSLPPVHTPLSYDYVLVAKTRENQEREAFRKQTEYIEELKKKNIRVTKIVDDDLIFYGIQAPKEVFEKYRYLLKVSDACNWSSDQCSMALSTRIRIVHFILNHTPIHSGEGLRDLLKTNVFEAKFCLHEKKKQRELKENWARWTACLQGQPITAVRKEVCESNTVMCPLCDNGCSVWQLSETCTYAKVNLLFDNNGTVLFAMFMAVWATLFLEFWKRHRASYVCEWKVSDWCEEEEELILEIVNNVKCEPKIHKHSYLRSTLVLICVTAMILVIIGLTHALVVFRVIAAVLLANGSFEFLRTYSNSGAMMLGAVFHYLIITVMTRINRIVAMKLCDIEETRSFAATEKSFTVKMFTFQFFTYFSSLFYVAFFWADLFIQMAIIMVLKQTINNVFEFTGPLVNAVSFLCQLVQQVGEKEKTHKLQRKCAHCYLKEESEAKHGAELCDNCKLRDWLNNFHLNDVDSFSLFNEFLEMVIQFSFTTIFVAAFPLAPLLALINNVIEIRLDAIKMVTLERRMVPKKTNDIGVWIDVLEAIGVLAVITNGLVIGVSSDFIPRLVYRYYYGPCANVNGTVKDMDYKDYRSNEDYSLTPQFWLILAVRFAFVILFEHVVVIFKFIAAWFVPSAPIQVKNDRLFDKLKRLKEELSSFEP